MTADAFARLIRARLTGRGKWIARCPAHRDRSPSLSIGVGKDGRVLLHCFAGCDYNAILEALGLNARDLFVGSHFLATGHSTNADIVASRRRCAEQVDQARRSLTDEYRRLSRVVDALGAKLARRPDTLSSGDAMTQLFHNALERLRAVESELDKDRKC